MDLRSRMVALFKVLLPLAALGILSTLFLLSRGTDPSARIPFAEQEMVDRVRDQQVTAPVFSGITAKGDEIVVTAKTASPGGLGIPAKATDLTATLTMADGVRLILTSDTGSMAIDKNLATFTGNVRITSTSGMLILTDTLHTALEGIAGNSPGTITGTGPMGDFTAGQMEIREKNKGGPLHMLFKKGVKLIYVPEISER